MSSTSPLLDLPYIETGQSQKEATHNEGLNMLEQLATRSVLSRVLTAPPVSPAPSNGQAWLVAAGATGVWSGKAKYIAAYYDGWIFIPPVEGLELWVVAESTSYRYVGTAWEEVVAASVTDVHFFAYLDTTVTNATGDGTSVTVVCETEVSDTHGAYSTSTGKFVAPVTGFYLFQGKTTLMSIDSAHTQFAFALDNDTHAYQQGSGNLWSLSGGQAVCLPCGLLLYMTAGEYVRMMVTAYNGTKTVDIRGKVVDTYVTYFSGKLLA